MDSCSNLGKLNDVEFRMCKIVLMENRNMDSCSRFSYTWDCKSRWSVEEHSVVLVGNKNPLLFFHRFSPLLLLLLLLQGNSIVILITCGILVKLFLRKTVERECVVVMPAFGLQLETHYLGGKVVRRFIPVDKILKPVLVERVTPLTCYWHLCLVVREQAESTSVFKQLRPPLKILIPIWKALCAATDQEADENSHRQREF